MLKRRLSLQAITLIALAAALNIVGSNLALLLRLPVYLDTIGTILAAALLGPIAGMLAGGITGLIVGFTTDLMSLYFLPVQLVIGLTAGFVFHKWQPDHWQSLGLTALLISLPGSIFSSTIAYFLFHGITSSGSSIIVQLLIGAGLNKAAAVLIAQFITDYFDRLIGVSVVAALYRVLKTRVKPSIWQ
ncbi:ECF transporter S component [Liquorilactobacillus nagelii]|uniref:ECF transporter S component n=1 Tax=Liquorilactobacillus nagelii TaxID=82688 RepID=UPI0039EA69D3